MSDVLTVEGFAVSARVGSRYADTRYGDIGRAFSGKLRSDTRAHHRSFSVQTVPLDSGDVEALHTILMTPGKLLCGGDAIGDDAYFHARNVVVQPGSGPFSSINFELNETSGATSVLLAGFDGDAPGPYTFVRAGTAKFTDEDGVIQTAGANRPRWFWIDWDDDGDLDVTYLHEAALTNVISEDDLTAWTPASTPVVTGSVDDPAGSTGAFTIEDDDGAATEYIVRAITFTTDAVKTLCFVVRENTMPASGVQRLRVRDTTAGATRLDLDISAWSAGEPTVTASTGTLLGTRYVGNGYWAIYGQTTPITVSNNNQVQLIPANTASATGSIDVYRVNAYNNPTPLVSIQDADGSHIEETLYQDIDFNPQALSIYLKFMETGVSSLSTSAYLVHLGSSGFSTPSISIYWAAAGYYACVFRSGYEGNTIADMSAASVPSWGDTVELLLTLDVSRGASSALQLDQSINGAAVATDSAGTLTRYGTAWADSDKMWLGSAGVAASTDVICPIITAKIFKGVQTMAQARNLARARIHPRIDTTVDGPATVTRLATAAGVSSVTVSLTVA